MENISLQKIAIETKLKQEEDGLLQLKDSLSKSEQLTFGMITILTSMENRLHKLEEAITPVHQETEHLTLLQENIEKASTVTDKLISIHQIPEEEEESVKRGPSDNVDLYLKSLEKLRKCVEFFIRSKPGSHDLDNCKSLFAEGANFLNREFRTILVQHCKPVPPAKLHEIITSHHDAVDAISLSSHGSLNSLTSANSIDAMPEFTIEHICESALDKLRLIANWLSEVANNEAFVETYSQVRSDICERSLTGLVDHIYKAAAGTHTFSTVAGLNKKHNPLTIETENKKKQKSGKRRELKRMPSSALMQPSAVRKNSTVPSLDSTGTGAEDFGRNFERAYTFPLVCIAFVKLSQSEMELMKLILPSKYWTSAFSNLLQKSLIFICGEGEKIIVLVKQCISKSEYAPILYACPILRHFRNMTTDYEVIFKVLPNSARIKLKNLISSFKEIGGKGLEEFTASIKNDPDKHSNLPKDGTVHELTSNTIIFMEHLMEYSETAGDMLNYNYQNTDPTSTQSQELGHVQCKTILGSYIVKVLGALGLNLERKAKCYENVALQSIFLMNNYHHILKSLERSGLIEWINALDDEVTLEEHYKILIEDQQRNYQKCWNKITQNLIEENRPYHSNLDESKMSRGSRQVIKDRFKAFNTGFEEVQRIQQHYTIPNEQLRNNIRKENINSIVPLYESFLQKHGNSQFTKNRDKYVKYSLQDLMNALSTFFDVSA